MPDRPFMVRLVRYCALGLGFVLLFVVAPLEMMRAGDGGPERPIAVGKDRR